MTQFDIIEEKKIERMLEQVFIDEYMNKDVVKDNFYSILDRVRPQIAKDLGSDLSSIKKLDWSEYSEEYSEDKLKDPLMNSYFNKFKEFFVFYFGLSYDDYENKHHYINYAMPKDLSLGIPKSWPKRSALNYTPLHDVEAIKEKFAFYKDKKWMHDKALDLLFLRLLVYDNYSCSYFAHLFHSGNRPFSFAEAFTRGNIFKVTIYKFLSPILRLLFGWGLPILIFLSFESIYIKWAIGLYLAFKLIFLPYRIYSYFRYAIPQKKDFAKKASISLRIFDEISTSSFNPIIIKDIATENKTDTSIFIQSTCHTVIDHFIDRYGNSFVQDK